MTAAIFDFAGPSSWGSASSNATQHAVYVGKAPQSSLPTATLGREQSYSDRIETLARIMDLAFKSPCIQRTALVRALSWVASLPEGFPRPFTAIGDDGSVSAEWDVSGYSLHVTFDHDTEEVYFYSPHGEEWESSLDASDKIFSAMRVIALSAKAQR